MKILRSAAPVLVALAACACSGHNNAPLADIEPAQASVAASKASTASAASVATLAVVRWGPDRVAAGKPFNQQPDGNSSLWFELNAPVTDPSLQATLGGMPLTGVVGNGNVVTALVPARYFAAAGRYPIEIVLPRAGRTIEAGTLVVE